MEQHKATRTRASRRKTRTHRHSLQMMFWLRDLFAETGASREDEQAMVAFGKHPDLPPVFAGVQCKTCDLLMLARRNDLLVEH